MKIAIRIIVSVLAVLALPLTAMAQSREEARMLVATQVLQEVKSMRDQNVPDWLLDRAYGVAVIPAVVKIGLGIGGRRGKGVLVVRDAKGRWTNPVFVALTGGSIGWQAGVQSTDVILVFTTKAGVEGITDGKLTLGADASVAAGPVGRQTSAATDANLSAEVYSYSRARGLFAGIAIDGSALTIDRTGNAAYYQKAGVSATDLMSSNPPPAPASGRRFLEALGQKPGDSVAVTPKEETKPAPEESFPPDASELKTYPIEDQSTTEEHKNN